MDEAFFLILVPWLYIIPAKLVARWLPFDYYFAEGKAAGFMVALAGLAYSLWAVASQWREGGGTPSLNAPTQRVANSGPYRFSRNPIQLGSSIYIMGLGIIACSFVTGLIAGLASLTFGILYIKLIEERELSARFGESYEAYRDRTPFLIPFLRGPVRGIRPSSNPSSIQEAEDVLADSLPTAGRVLVRAAYVYDFVQPLVTLGQEARMNRRIAEWVRPTAGMRVLDVGCGTGLLTASIADRFPACVAEGIDASGPMIRVARRKRTRPNCLFQQALGESLPYPDEHFDIITSALFFHHVNENLKLRCLREAYRTLKPGGRLLIADMDKPYTILGWMLSYGAWILFRQPEIKENLDGVLRAKVREAGFSAIENLDHFSGYICVFTARRPQ